MQFANVFKKLEVLKAIVAGKTTDLNMEHPLKVEPNWLHADMLVGKVIFVKRIQLLNPLERSVTVFNVVGNVMDLIVLQLVNTPDKVVKTGMLVGIVKDFNSMQPLKALAIVVNKFCAPGVQYISVKETHP